MEVTLALNLARPARLIGLVHNHKLMDELSNKVDGLGTLLYVSMEEPATVLVSASFERDGGSAGTTINDPDRATEWACEQLAKNCDWKVLEVALEEFEPDEC